MLDEVVEKNFEKITLQQFGIIFYTYLNNLHIIPDWKLREAFNKYLDKNKEEPL